MSNSKKVSVLIPCRNEVEAVHDCLENVFELEPPEGGFEVIIIDGMSNDGTRDVIMKMINKYSDLIMLDNPMKTIPHAMNIGIRKARGEYIIRVDVRCVHSKDYLNALIAFSEETKADNVGGVLEPKGKTLKQQCIAIAYKSPIAMGGALRDRGDFVGETDAVYGGCWKKDRLIEIGAYDESMIKNEDDELSFRLRKAGGTVMQSGAIKAIYYPRKEFNHLFKQFLQYGYWKIPVLEKHPKQASVRHLAPTALVLFFAILGFGAFFHEYTATVFIAYVASYIMIVGLESIRLSYKSCFKLFPLIGFSIATIHFGYGLGFFIGGVCSLFNIKPKWFEGLTR